MIEDFFQFNELEQTGFTFEGNYRAIVEDTSDPENSGRVRVRILGFHPLDEKSTPVENLPWAMPALTLYHAGGKMTAKNLNNDVEMKERYLPKKDLKSKLKDIPSPNVSQMTPTDGEFKDEIMDECGASAIYTVPRKGSMVWVFFERGCHLSVHYWSACPRVQDWTAQREHIDNIIKEKRDEISQIRTKVSQGAQKIDKTEWFSSTKPTERLKIATKIPDPKLFMHTLENIKNEDITSFSTATGTTYVIVNKDGKERTYIFHKGESQYVDENGQVKHFIGLSENNNGNKTENDYQVMVANNHDLHIIGDFNLYVRNNYLLDAELDLQMVVRRNAGIIVKEGDVDIMCDRGHVNVTCPEGNVNVLCQEMQAKVKKNLVMEVAEHADIKVDKSATFNVKGDTNINCEKQINIKAGEDMNFECDGNFKLKAKDIDLYATQSFKQTGNQQLHLNSGQEIKCKAGGDSNLDMDSSGVKLSGSEADLNGDTVRIGGVVEMGSAQDAQGGDDAEQPQIIINNWLEFRPSPQKVAKGLKPNEQKSTDEDNAS